MRRVFVADDHAIVCQGLRAWIETVPGLAWAGSAHDGAELLARARDEGDVWHALVLDLSLPGYSGDELLRAVLSLRPTLAVVVFSMYPEREYAAWALRAGARAYVSKTEPLDALRGALLGERRVEEPKGAGRGGAPLHESLTARERAVFMALARGSTPSEIAWELAMAPSTVSTHLKAVRTKLDVRSTLEVAQYAARHGITGRE